MLQPLSSNVGKQVVHVHDIGRKRLKVAGRVSTTSCHHAGGSSSTVAGLHLKIICVPSEKQYLMSGIAQGLSLTLDNDILTAGPSTRIE